MIKSNALEEQNHPILLFDGVCNLCNGFVQFIIKQDKQQKIKFTSLQSETAHQLLKQQTTYLQSLDTVVLIDNGQIYTHSEVPLHIAQLLGGWWNLLLIGKVIPKKLRNQMYRLVAKNRYRWFGKQSTCWIPTPELKARFL